MIHCKLASLYSETQLARPVSEEGDQQRTLDRGELKELKERNISLEKECVIYQNQLKVISNDLGTVFFKKLKVKICM